MNPAWPRSISPVRFDPSCSKRITYQRYTDSKEYAIRALSVLNVRVPRSAMDVRREQTPVDGIDDDGTDDLSSPRNHEIPFESHLRRIELTP